MAGEDSFTFKTRLVDHKDIFTKREFLKRIATIFNPLGFIYPFTIRGKILLQEMRVSGLDWDEQVSKDLVKITQWISELSSLSEIKVVRSLQVQKMVKSVS